MYLDKSLRWEHGVADLIGLLHNARMPVIDAVRLRSAHSHFVRMPVLSRKMWKAILLETDDRCEWIPSPKQRSITGVEITDVMVVQWDEFLNEYSAILAGEKLVPHWRFTGVGVNMKRVFFESKETDLILWVTGEAALPYLEKGELSDRARWRQITRSFGGDFVGMSFWIN